MRRFLLSVALALCALALPAQTTALGVAMEGASEVPPGDFNGVGFADLVLEGTTLRYAVVVFNIDPPTSMHIHRGRRGETNAPLITFSLPFSREPGCPSLGAPSCVERFLSVGTLEISPDDAGTLRTQPADLYLNVHNDPHPAGAVRGQIQHARYIPIVGDTPGAAGTHWFTRFAALNRSIVSASEWLIEFIPQSPAGNTDRYLAVQNAISPSNLYFSTTFPVPNYTGIGAARVLSDEPMEVTASVYNGMGGARGDFGYSVRGRGIEEARTAGLLIDLTASSAADVQARTGHRSNIGYFNPQLRSVDVTFRAYGRDGSLLGERVVTMPPGAMAQPAAFDLIDTVPAAQRVRDAFWVSWTANAPI
ncbi:MAG TPA: CHRD domain-containing protein, partial [Thermoanaerobaculia bacterium]|nr:CHRD domain-containing protein [Thermoanaerobaculia bacterium]